jgi:replicative DNA helicase
MKPSDFEAILIGAVLQFGREAALSVMPQLTADKFIFSFEGGLGGDDNLKLWRVIEQVVLVDRSDPIIDTGAVKAKIGDETLLGYIDGYVNRLHYEFKITRLDIETLRNFARQVHKQGIVYQHVRLANQLSPLNDPETFASYMDKVKDPDDWAEKVLTSFQKMGGGGEEQYVPLNDVVEEVVAEAEASMRGEQTYLLPVGFPVLYAGGLLPAEAMIVVHGGSGLGKSTLVHNVFNLGTAIGMSYYGIKGCVAINSLEMSRKDFLSRAAASLAGFNTFKMKTRPQEITAEDYKRYIEYVEFAGKLPIWIDDTPGISIFELRHRMAGVHLGAYGPVRQLSTDYLELFDTNGKKEESREQEIGDLTAAHFQIKRDYHTCVIAISQSTFSSKTYVAGMMGARYSKAIAHKPDIVLEFVNYMAHKKSGTDYIVADNLDEEHAWILIQKYRGGPTDAKIALGWEPEFTRLYDPAMVGIDGSMPMFEHLAEVETLLKDHPTTHIIPFSDTPLAQIDFPLVGGDF